MKYDKDFRKRVAENSSNARYCDDCEILIIARNPGYAYIQYQAHKEFCTEGSEYE